MKLFKYVNFLPEATLKLLKMITYVRRLKNVQVYIRESKTRLSLENKLKNKGRVYFMNGPPE
jgi:hypothetical protein